MNQCSPLPAWSFRIADDGLSFRCNNCATFCCSRFSQDLGTILGLLNWHHADAHGQAGQRPGAKPGRGAVGHLGVLAVADAAVRKASRMQEVELDIGPEATARLMELSRTTPESFEFWLRLWKVVLGNRERFEALVPLALVRAAEDRFREVSGGAYR